MLLLMGVLLLIKEKLRRDKDNGEMCGCCGGKLMFFHNQFSIKLDYRLKFL